MIAVRMKLFGSVTALSMTLAAFPAFAGDINIINVTSSNGYQFTNFDGPAPNGGGTTINGISNSGVVVGFTSANDANDNFTANPLVSPSATALDINNSTVAMANGINSSGVVVGSDGNNAFSLNGNSLVEFVPNGGVTAAAFGINDKGLIAGQYSTASGATPGFVLNGTTVTTINAPTGPNFVNAQGINNNGLVVGFYLGNDGQDHGFDFKLGTATNNTGVGTPIADPTIPPLAGEPNATFVFSQILGVNDQGIAVGYDGDSTGSQHAFLYNTNSGQYTFIDDPNAAFDNGVEVTQITGINDSGEITGFYTDANGLAHGFVATVSTPEPSSIALLGIGMTAALAYIRRRRQAVHCYNHKVV